MTSTEGEIVVVQRIGFVVVACICAVPVALAEITEWGGATGGYAINELHVVITAPGTFGFQSITNGQPDDINTITVAPGVQGNVYLYIQFDPNQASAPGARHVKLINLSNAAHAYLRAVRITGDLGEEGLSVFDAAGAFETEPNNPLVIGGDLRGDLVTYEPNEVAGAIGNVTIGGQLSAAIEGNSLGNITVNGTDPHTGSITGHDHYGGTISIGGPMNGNITFSHQNTLHLSSSITIHGDFNGYFSAHLAHCIVDPNDANQAFDFHVTGDVGNTNPDTLIDPGSLGHPASSITGGTIHIDGDLAGGTIDAWSPSTDLEGSILIGGDCGGRIHCGRDVVGTIQIDGSVLDNDPNDLDPNNLDPNRDSIQIDGIVGSPIQIGGNCAGRIHFKDDLNAVLRINGSLSPNNADPNSYEIKIDGTLGTDPGYGGSVAVDYDGWDPNQDWLSGARILVGPNPAVPYTTNDPNMHLWHISDCRGDMNNDWAVGYADINPFVAALTNPNKYYYDFPGLDGSVDWHGDCNASDGNETLGMEDINAFVDLVTGEICDPNGLPDQEDSEEEEEGGRAAAIATLLGTYVSAEQYDDLLEIVAGAADYYAEDAERGALWDDVYDLLSE